MIIYIIVIDIFIKILIDNPSCDHECLELLVSRGLVSKLVSTPLYHQLVNMVVEEEESVGNQVVDQLVQGGHKPQAMSLKVLQITYQLIN